MTEAQNPLLETFFRPPFERIRAEHVVPGIGRLLEEARERIEGIADDDGPPTWESVMAPLDSMAESLRRATTPVHHLLQVRESEDLRKAWGEVLPELTGFWSSLYLHEGLWARVQGLAESAEAERLDDLRARHLEKTVRSFQRAGATLDPSGRERLREIDIELARLQQSFAENILDATARYELHVTDEARMAGIPQDARDRMHRRAEETDREGWILTLDQPSYEAVVRFAEDRSLRHEIQQAYLSRGTEDPGDNRPLIGRILGLRREKAHLLGYSDFPDYRLEEQMVKSGRRAREFVEEVAERTRPYWERDLADLQAFAADSGIDPLEPWDVAFLIERMRRKRFDLDEEELRPYFPLDSVMEGMFEICRRLFGVSAERKDVPETWHEDAEYYELRDEEGALLGGFYADLFPRKEKRQGAWMNDFAYGEPMPDGGFHPHLGVICANFPPPSADKPALLSHRDVETLFHEFGHLLHHLTSRVPIAARGGINVAWDWVELPSQLLENWTWERDALDHFARHWETGERLPDELFARMVNARRFMGGWQQMRQLGFGTLDLALHTDFDPEGDDDPVAWVSDLLEPFSPSRRFAESHPLPSFLHIFSGGYAASYYSYLWSEVLEADLFTRFSSGGVFDREIGRSYVETILSTGDREEPEALFRAFMGRDPDPEALITRNLGEVA